MTHMSQILDGEVTITLGGEETMLAPTLFAATRISRQFGGLQVAMNKVAVGDIEALTLVIRYGLGLKTEAEAQGLDEKVFRSGVLKLTTPVTEYLLILANGGRRLETEEPPKSPPPEAEAAA